MGLLDFLRIPSGPNQITAFTEAALWLRKNYIQNGDAENGEMGRRVEMRKRKLLYNDDGDEFMMAIIDRAFQDKKVRALRRALVPYTKFDNALKRIVNELSTVYIEPPVRTVGKRPDADENLDPEKDSPDNKQNARYKLVQIATNQNQLFRRANRWMNLFNNVLIWFRVREDRAAVLDDAGKELVAAVRAPVMDVISPDMFWAVSDPFDPTRLIAIIFDIAPSGTSIKASWPHFAVWADDVKFQLDKNSRLIESSLMPNELGRIPGLIISVEPPDQTILDSTSGDDLVSAHLMAWLENTMLIKESKSISKQAAIGGDLQTMATGQSQDTETDLILPEGATIQTIDRSIDLEQFRATADHIIERVAANRGIPPSVLRHNGATSGDELRLRLIGLRERRRDQIMLFRKVEREYAEIQSIVLARDLPSLAFSTEGWKIDYPEIEIPLGAEEALRVFEKERQLGLTDTLEEIMKRNPDLRDKAAAIRELIGHTLAELARNVAMRPLQKINGSTNQSQDEAKTAEDNGRDGGEAAAAAADDEPGRIVN